MTGLKVIVQRDFFTFFFVSQLLYFSMAQKGIHKRDFELCHLFVKIFESQIDSSLLMTAEGKKLTHGNRDFLNFEHSSLVCLSSPNKFRSQLIRQIHVVDLRIIYGLTGCIWLADLHQWQSKIPLRLSA